LDPLFERQEEMEIATGVALDLWLIEPNSEVDLP
jgi:hypothetical protein